MSEEGAAEGPVLETIESVGGGGGRREGAMEEMYWILPAHRPMGLIHIHQDQILNVPRRGWRHPDKGASTFSVTKRQLKTKRKFHLALKRKICIFPLVNHQREKEKNLKKRTRTGKKRNEA